MNDQARPLVSSCGNRSAHRVTSGLRPPPPLHLPLLSRERPLHHVTIAWLIVGARIFFVVAAVMTPMLGNGDEAVTFSGGVAFTLPSFHSHDERARFG